MAVRIVADSGCDLPPDLSQELEAWDSHIVPFLFHFGLESCTDKSMPMAEFLAKAAAVWPTTAAPSIGSYTQAYEKIVAAGDQALCLTITGRHSATYGTALLAAQAFSSDQVAVVDTRSLSMGEGLLALAAVRAARAGASLQEIVALLHDMIGRVRLFIGLDTLDYVVKGGRANRIVGMVASLLHVRPILSVEDGELALRDRPRLRTKARDRLLALAETCLPAEAMGVMHVAAAQEAATLADALADLTGWARSAIPVVETGMALATHAGPGGLGIVAISERAEQAEPESRRTVLGRELPRINLPHRGRGED